jgi:hypothetical protein
MSYDRYWNVALILVMRMYLIRDLTKLEFVGINKERNTIT